MVEASFTKCAFQPTKLTVDLSFWLEFTRRKLDIWKLDTPRVEIEATISLPSNPNLPSDLVLNAQSLSKQRRKVIGGLVASTVTGVLIHTNTIEEYHALDVEAIAKQQQQLLLDRLDADPNRFVLLLFGDLKNYKYYYRYCTLDLDASKVNQTYANLVGTLIKDQSA